MDGDREVGRLAANTLVKDRVTVLGTHKLAGAEDWSTTDPAVHGLGYRRLWVWRAQL